MPAETLLVCGARALTRSPAASQWARDAIADFLRDRTSEALVLFGDASGPDTWASDAAKAAGLPWQRFSRHGEVVDQDGVQAFWIRELRPSNAAEWKRRLLARDRALAARLAYGLGPRRALGLLAPWPNADGRKTHGTAYTIQQCMEQGVDVVTVLTCPVALGPAVRASPETKTSPRTPGAPTCEVHDDACSDGKTALDLWRCSLCRRLGCADAWNDRGGAVVCVDCDHAPAGAAR